MEDKISNWMLEKIKRGQAILFLGSGATYGAKINNAAKTISGNHLRDLICDEFLGGDQKDKSLIQVADYAKYQAGLHEVQVFIGNLFRPMQPAEFHKLIPLFRWHAIFTTNYDLVLERAYDLVSDRAQTLAPIIRDGDQFSLAMRNPEMLPYFKLHGCITVVNDKQLPLILASDEYAKHKNNRKLLFQHLSTFGREHPIIFCGYKIGDPNIQQILFDLFDNGISRPSYMVVDPGLNKYDIQMWRANRVDPITAKFADFLAYLDRSIPKNQRILGSIFDSSVKSYNKHLKGNANPSLQLARYLNTELEHVYIGMALEGVKPVDFYTGMDDAWGGINQNLDVHRKINDQILIDSLIDEKISGVKSFLIKGYAGSGKSVCLRRVAWNAAKDFDSPVFYLRKGSVLRPSLVRELCEIAEGRILFVVDDILSNRNDMIKLYQLLSREVFNISIVTTTRSNEWNQQGGDVEPFITSEYELDRLSNTEIDTLVDKLQEHKCLGNLKNVNLEDVKNNFGLTSDRQLLVALHEVTSGKPFEQIIFDEYQRVTPTEAQLLYMDVCTLNRLNVPVRAGLISRISGISIEDFKQNFIAPLEHLVKVYTDQRSRDYVYVSRHPIIAEFVFDHANAKPRDKAEQLVRVISKMNIDYEADSIAFSALIRGKSLANLFSDKMLANRIYQAAEEAGAPLHYIWHQRAVFELHHPGTDLQAAMNAVQNAEKYTEENRSDKSIQHTKALIYRRMAKDSGNPLEVEKFRAEARIILERLVKSEKDSRSAHALAELALDELDDRLRLISPIAGAADDLEERALINIIKKAEDAIYKGLQHHPRDEFLLMSKAALARKLNEHENVTKILENAYDKNLSSEYVAISLARNRNSRNDLQGAIEVVRTGVSQSPNSKPLHLELAKYLIQLNNQALADEIMHHLKRSFSPGDTNYDAQFWFARQQYLFGDRPTAQSVFDNLRKTRMPPYLRRRLDGHSVNSSGVEVRYNGQIVSEHIDFCFIKCIELGDEIFSHLTYFQDPSGNGFSVGLDVAFSLAFSIRGPVATKVVVFTQK